MGSAGLDMRDFGNAPVVVLGLNSSDEMVNSPKNQSIEKSFSECAWFILFAFKGGGQVANPEFATLNAKKSESEIHCAIPIGQ